MKYLKYFTFLSKEEIASYEEKVQTAPEKREAQRRLAEEVTTLVHGRESLEQAVNISNALFKGEIKSLTAEEVKVGFKDVPSMEKDSAEELTLVDVLVESKLSPSKRQAREDITNGAVSINGERQTNKDYVLSAEDRIENQFTVLRRGKKKYFLVTYK